MTFYLGTHQPAWLRTFTVPLFISHRRLAKYRTLPIARCHWALDSGAFSELSQYGKWTVAPEQYVRAVRRYRDEIGKLDWAAPQDWMSEPQIVAKTGLSVAEHQRRTIENYIILRRIAPELPFIPVIQGWTLNDYLRCIAMYRQCGIQLKAEPLVGLGSICRRQAGAEIEEVIANLAARGLRLHGFGVKVAGLKKYGPCLASADSLAWSSRGRHILGCRHPRPTNARHPTSEANCPRFALEWRQRATACTTSSNPKLHRRTAPWNTTHPKEVNFEPPSNTLAGPNTSALSPLMPG